MSLQIRRGTTADRLSITPIEGELIYDTVEKALYVGDGTTVGGIATAPSSVSNIEDTAAALFTNGTHANISYVYDNLNAKINSTVNLSNYSGIITATGLKGNLYANDDSLLVDATLKGFELEGTVRTNITPFSDGSYDLGSFTNRFKDLYLSGNSLFLGDAVINAVGSAVSLPAGSTVGGIPIGDGILEGGTYQINILGSDSSLIVNTFTSSINAAGGVFGDLFGDVTGNVFGNVTGDVIGVLTGSVYGQDSSVLVNGFTGEIGGTFIGDLGANLNTNGFALLDSNVLAIVSQNYTQFGSSSPAVNGNIVIRRNSYTGGILDGKGGFLYDQYHNNFLSDRFVFHRSRGTPTAPLPLQTNDQIAELIFVGNTSVAPFSQASAAIRIVANSAPVSNTIPGRIEFRTNNGDGSGLNRVMVLTPDLRTLTDKIEGLRTTLTVIGNLYGSVIGDDSSTIVDSTTSSINASSVNATSFVQFGSLTTAERNALSAVNGMVIYNTTNNKFEGYQNGSWIYLDTGAPAA